MTAKISILAMVTLLLTPVVTANALDFQTGLYRITSTTAIPGMPPMPGHQVEQCLTRERPLSGETLGPGCTMDTMQTSGNTLSWKMNCSQQGMTSTGQGTMTYEKDRFSGNFATSMVTGGETVTVKTTINGVRIGPCP